MVEETPNEGFQLSRIPERFNSDWFQQRAYSNLKGLGEGRWDYSDSLLLYLPDFDDIYEEFQDTETLYHKLITAPERAYLKAISAEVVGSLPNGFEYIDLGPGTEHKEQFIFNEAKRQGKNFIYRPVDISERYLNLSVAYASQQGIVVDPIQASFEEVSKFLSSDEHKRFVSLGLTYGNYHPRDAHRILKSITGNLGTAFINAQIKGRVDTKALIGIYTDVAYAMTFPKLELIGFNPEKDLELPRVTDEVKVWRKVKVTNPILEAIGLRPGDDLLLFQSLRPTKEQLLGNLSQDFREVKLMDSNSEFVGAILRP